MNRHNYIRYIQWCYKGSVIFEGAPRFIAWDVVFDPSRKIFVGGGSTIAAQTTILTHDYSIDYGLMAVGKHDPLHERSYCKEVYIGRNTFIGQKCMILPGVRIGDNCVIGAGSIITHDIPDNCVAAGIPAKVIEPVSAWVEKRLTRDIENIV